MSTYSFKDVQAAITGPGGAFPLAPDTGVAEEGISIAPVEDKNTMVTGADGSVMNSLHAAQAGTATLRLLKTSPVNAALTELYNFQTQSSANHGQNTIVISDLARGDLISLQQVAFAKYPDLNYGKEGGTVEWLFHAGKIVYLLGVGSDFRL